MLWLNVAVNPHFPWPNVSVEFVVEGKRLVVQPRFDENTAAAVSIYDEKGITFEIGGGIVSRFLSRLAWSQDSGVAESFCAGSNNPAMPGRLGQGVWPCFNRNQNPSWGLLYLPLPPTPEAALALALYREGLNLRPTSAPFSFLSFSKVLNIRYGTGREQIEWINNNLSNIKYEPELTRLLHLRKNDTDVGSYMYELGRCAVAHAHSPPLANPDDYADRKRLEDDLELIKKLAAIAIENEFGVRSCSAFWEMMRQTEGRSPDLLMPAARADGTVYYEEAT